MIHSPERHGAESIQLSDKVAEVLALLPGEIANQLRRDTERMLRESYDRFRDSNVRHRHSIWLRRRDRRGPWMKGN